MPHAKTSGRAIKCAAWTVAFLVACIHPAAFGQSLTVPAQFVYWTTYGPPGGPGSRYYYFATGDEACQFACQQGDSRCRDSGWSQSWTGTGACGAITFTHTVRFWLTGSPYWDYAANHVISITDYHERGQPIRIVDANGVVTVLTYDPRMRLTSRTIGKEATPCLDMTRWCR